MSDELKGKPPCVLCGQMITTDHGDYITWKCPCGRTSGYAHKTEGHIEGLGVVE